METGNRVTVTAIRYGKGENDIVDICFGKDWTAAVSACERDFLLMSYSDQKRVDRYVVEEFPAEEEDLTDENRVRCAVLDSYTKPDGSFGCYWWDDKYHGKRAYTYDELFARALDTRAANDCGNLARWLDDHGAYGWNGEFFALENDMRLFPIYDDVDPDDPQIVGYEIR